MSPALHRISGKPNLFLKILFLACFPNMYNSNSHPQQKSSKQTEIHKTSSVPMSFRIFRFWGFCAPPALLKCSRYRSAKQSSAHCAIWVRHWTSRRLPTLPSWRVRWQRSPWCLRVTLTLWCRWYLLCLAEDGDCREGQSRNRMQQHDCGIT